MKTSFLKPSVYGVFSVLTLQPKCIYCDVGFDKVDIINPTKPYAIATCYKCNKKFLNIWSGMLELVINILDIEQAQRYFDAYKFLYLPSTKETLWL